MPKHALDKLVSANMRCMKCGCAALTGPPPLQDKNCDCLSEQVHRPIRMLEPSRDVINEESYAADVSAHYNSYLRDRQRKVVSISSSDLLDEFSLHNDQLICQKFPRWTERERLSLNGSTNSSSNSSSNNSSNSTSNNSSNNPSKSGRRNLPVAAVPPTTPSATLLALRLPPTFKIVETLGEGGMGVVYRVRDEQAGRQVAVKVMRPEYAGDRAALKRFRKEAAAVSELTHPNIAQVYGFAAADAPYMVMEYVDGVSLAEVIQHERCLPVDRAMNITMQITEALEHAHDKGVVHRDLKPSNVLIIEGQVSDYIKLVDFGIAKLDPANDSATALTQAGQIFGSPRYMSPEQAHGYIVDHRSDLYSLGCIMFEMLSGCALFPGANPIQVLLHHINTPPQERFEYLRRNRVPKSIIHIIGKLLEKNPAARYQSARDLAMDLRRVQNGQLPIGLIAKKVAVILTLCAIFLSAIIVFFSVSHMQNNRSTPARIGMRGTDTSVTGLGNRSLKEFHDYMAQPKNNSIIQVDVDDITTDSTYRYRNEELRNSRRELARNLDPLQTQSKTKSRNWKTDGLVRTQGPADEFPPSQAIFDGEFIQNHSTVSEDSNQTNMPSHSSVGEVSNQSTSIDFPWNDTTVNPVSRRSHPHSSETEFRRSIYWAEAPALNGQSH